VKNITDKCITVSVRESYFLNKCGTILHYCPLKSIQLDYLVTFYGKYVKHLLLTYCKGHFPPKVK